MNNSELHDDDKALLKSILAWALEREDFTLQADGRWIPGFLFPDEGELREALDLDEDEPLRDKDAALEQWVEHQFAHWDADLIPTYALVSVDMSAMGQSASGVGLLLTRGYSFSGISREIVEIFEYSDDAVEWLDENGRRESRG